MTYPLLPPTGTQDRNVNVSRCGELARTSSIKVACAILYLRQGKVERVQSEPGVICPLQARFVG